MQGQRGVVCVKWGGDGGEPEQPRTFVFPRPPTPKPDPHTARPFASALCTLTAVDKASVRDSSSYRRARARQGLRWLRQLAALCAVLRSLDPALRAPALGRVFFRRHSMLKIYPVVIEFVGTLRPLLAQIERRDRDLGRQLRRAASSVALNLGEGMYSRGELRTARYHTALGSMRESLSCLEVAQAFGYVRTLDESLLAQVNRIIGTLVRLVEGHHK